MACTFTPDQEPAVRYEEGSPIGYLGFQTGLTPEPLFWSGHGLVTAAHTSHGAMAPL
jgi:hypothetical protein